MSPGTEGDTSSLEQARERLYDESEPVSAEHHPLLMATDKKILPHAWKNETLAYFAHKGGRHVRLASVFLVGAFLFFLLAIGVAAYVFLVDGNSVSVSKISIDIQGPTAIAGGDSVPLSLKITNRNTVALQNAVIEIDFPNGTRDANDVLKPYPHYIETIGTLAPGESVTRSVKAVLFGGAGQAISLPILFSYGTTGSNATFVKNASYGLTISTTPLSVSIDALTETVSGQPFTLTLTVASNSTAPLENVVLSGAFPFGFTVTSSSLPLSNSSFLIGTLAPGAHKTITLTGTLVGQDSEQRVFRFVAGTAKTGRDSDLAISYMTQDAVVTIAPPFIRTSLAINGNTSPNAVVNAQSLQSVTVNYTNTLPTTVSNATVVIAISGPAVDYESIKTYSGFYNSADHTLVFSKDTDPSLMTLAPGASGVGMFTFETLPMNSQVSSPTITFTISVSGTRVGQSNVPERVSASAIRSAKVATSVVFTAYTLHASGPIRNSGPIPPTANQPTTYTIVWNTRNEGNAVAGGVVSATLPSYVTYTGQTSGSGQFSYNQSSRMVSWNTGDLVQGAVAQGAFQVSITPSTSQHGMSPFLTTDASFSGYDRFAGVQVSAGADAVSTATTRDPGYTPALGSVE